MSTPPPDLADRLAGLLLGTACGDALGLPVEGLSTRRGARFLGPGPLRHRLIGNAGLCSDDTEQTALVAQALLAEPQDPGAFARSLAWGLRLWILGAPAGIGFATLRAIGKLWLGISPPRSGIRSAGNGAAMRSALLGACSTDPARVRELARAAATVTHTDPRAVEGAVVVAMGAHLAIRGEAPWQPETILGLLRAEVTDPELGAAFARVAEHLARGASGAELAAALGLERGITGFSCHTVPVAIFCWLRHAPRFDAALEEVIRLGGDTDTTAAIVGGLAGATSGTAGIPPAWIDGIREWPRSTAWLRRVADRLARTFPLSGPGARPGPEPLFWPGLLLRNAVFFWVVLAHGFRRLLPPY